MCVCISVPDLSSASAKNICVHVSICVYVCGCVRVHVHIYVYVSANVYICMYIYIYICTYICIYVHKQTGTHTHTRVYKTHIYICMQAPGECKGAEFRLFVSVANPWNVACQIVVSLRRCLSRTPGFTRRRWRFPGELNDHWGEF